ncbi:MAG: helix-turn-helix transcriptional regulator [Oscillospiraceae bacterium]
MTNHDFYILFSAAASEPDEDLYIAEWGTSSIFCPDPDAPAPDIDAIVHDLREIWRAAHMSVRDIRKSAGLTQAELSAHFCIPPKSIQNWESSSPSAARSCAPYIRLMMAEALDIVHIDRG